MNARAAKLLAAARNPRLAGLLLLAATAVFLGWHFDLTGRLTALFTVIRGWGAAGILVFVLAYIAACIFLVPGSVITLAAGAIYGVVLGTVYVSIGSTLGAAAAFLLGRTLARDWVVKKIERNEKFVAVDAAVGREGWKIVLMTRLSPVFPFNLLNYMFGLTRVSFRGYFFSSWLGMLPGTVMYVYIGSLIGDLTALSAGGRQRTTAEWILYAAGLAATVAVTAYVTRIARRALTEKVGTPAA